MANAADDARFRALETRVQELEAENAELKAAKKPSPVPQPQRQPDEEGARVTFLRDYPIPMPTRVEYEKLLAIVARAGFVPRSADPVEFFAGFVASFERLASLRRLEGLDRPAHYWAMETYGWLQQRGTLAETMNGSFFAAAIAAGDVPYSLANSAMGVPARLGLTHDSCLTHDSYARPALPAWRGVLERGQPRPPVSASQRMELESERAIPVNIRYSA